MAFEKLTQYFKKHSGQTFIASFLVLSMAVGFGNKLYESFLYEDPCSACKEMTPTKDVNDDGVVDFTDKEITFQTIRKMTSLRQHYSCDSISIDTDNDSIIDRKNYNFYGLGHQQVSMHAFIDKNQDGEAEIEELIAYDYNQFGKVTKEYRVFFDAKNYSRHKINVLEYGYDSTGTTIDIEVTTPDYFDYVLPQKSSK